MNQDNGQSLNCTKRISRIGMALWMYLFAQVILGFLSGLPVLFGGSPSTPLIMLAAVLAGVPALALGVGITKTRITGLKTLGSGFVPVFIRALPMTFFFSIGFALLWMLLGAGNQSVTQGVSSWTDVVLTLLVTGLVGPVIEELFFRGFAYNCLKPYGAVFAAVISSLAFSFLHMNFSQGIAVFFFGLVFCWGYEKTGSLWLPVSLHVINNSVSVLSGYFPVFTWISLALGALGLGVLVLMVPEIRQGWKDLMARRQLFRCMWKAPAFWLVGVVFVGVSGFLVFFS